MQRSHRRKQLLRNFVCIIQLCGKAYGSYAALSTHIKNKHPQHRDNSMRPLVQKQNTGRKGRPARKHQQIMKLEFQEEDGQCQICMESPCFCDSLILAQNPHEATMNCLQNKRFMSFINSVGDLSMGDMNWTRSTQDQPSILSVGDLLVMLNQFLQQHKLQKTILPLELLALLSFSSRYWIQAHQKELIHSIFLVLYYNEFQEDSINQFFANNAKSFSFMVLCRQNKQTQWKKWQSSVRGLRQVYE